MLISCPPVAMIRLIVAFPAADRCPLPDCRLHHTNRNVLLTMTISPYSGVYSRSDISRRSLSCRGFPHGISVYCDRTHYIGKQQNDYENRNEYGFQYLCHIAQKKNFSAAPAAAFLPFCIVCCSIPPFSISNRWCFRQPVACLPIIKKDNTVPFYCRQAGVMNKRRHAHRFCPSLHFVHDSFDYRICSLTLAALPTLSRR